MFVLLLTFSAGRVRKGSARDCRSKSDRPTKRPFLCCDAFSCYVTYMCITGDHNADIVSDCEMNALVDTESSENFISSAITRDLSLEVTQKFGTVEESHVNIGEYLKESECTHQPRKSHFLPKCSLRYFHLACNIRHKRDFCNKVLSSEQLQQISSWKKNGLRCMHVDEGWRSISIYCLFLTF